jgi:hypothetical protein
MFYISLNVSKRVESLYSWQQMWSWRIYGQSLSAVLLPAGL